jgi:hypothetical protein
VFTARYGLYLCVLCGSQNKQRLFHCTTLTGCLYNRRCPYNECIIKFSAVECLLPNYVYFAYAVFLSLSSLVNKGHKIVYLLLQERLIKLFVYFLCSLFPHTNNYVHTVLPPVEMGMKKFYGKYVTNDLLSPYTKRHHFL